MPLTSPVGWHQPSDAGGHPTGKMLSKKVFGVGRRAGDVDEGTRLLCLKSVQYKNGNIIIICLYGSQLVQSRLSAAAGQTSIIATV